MTGSSYNKVPKQFNSSYLNTLSFLATINYSLTFCKMRIHIEQVRSRLYIALSEVNEETILRTFKRLYF